jgi:hypothetical protein
MEIAHFVHLAISERDRRPRGDTERRVDRLALADDRSDYLPATGKISERCGVPGATGGRMD